MNFDQYTRDANEFMKHVARELGNENDTDHAYRVTAAVFHVLRDIITPEESLHLVAQLPMYLKAVYVHDWHLPAKERVHTMDELLQQLRSISARTAARDFDDDETAQQKVMCVLKVLKQYIDPNETEDILSQFPTDLLELWATQVDEPVK